MFKLFNQNQCYFETSEIQDLKNQLAVVVCNGDEKGFLVCLELVSKGATVFVLCDNEAKGCKIVADIESTIKGGVIRHFGMDFGNLGQVAKATETVVLELQKAMGLYDSKIKDEETEIRCDLADMRENEGNTASTSSQKDDSLEICDSTVEDIDTANTDSHESSRIIDTNNGGPFEFEEMKQLLNDMRFTIYINMNEYLAPEFELTIDGIESNHQRNHLAPLLILQKLIPLISHNNNSRVCINVSQNHRFAPNSKTIVGKLSHSNLERFALSQIANLAITQKLDTLYNGSIIFSAFQMAGSRHELMEMFESEFGIIATIFKPLIELNASRYTLTSADVALTPLYCGAIVEESNCYWAPFAKMICKIDMDVESVDRIWESASNIIDPFNKPILGYDRNIIESK